MCYVKVTLAVLFAAALVGWATAKPAKKPIEDFRGDKSSCFEWSDGCVVCAGRLAHKISCVTIKARCGTSAKKI